MTDRGEHTLDTWWECPLRCPAAVRLLPVPSDPDERLTVVFAHLVERHRCGQAGGLSEQNALAVMVTAALAPALAAPAVAEAEQAGVTAEAEQVAGEWQSNTSQ